MARGYGRIRPTAGVRPTTSKVMESLLAILQPRSPGAHVLDIFAGTGQLGLSLLAQGAATVTFVERDVRVARCLRDRVKREGQISCSRVVTGVVPEALVRLEGPYDIVVADPPYDWAGSARLLLALESLIASCGVVVIEHHHKTIYSEGGGWELVRCRRFGESQLSFFEFQPGHHAEATSKASHPG